MLGFCDFGIKECTKQTRKQIITMKLFIRGVRSGIPIGVGYIPVSFSFGIIAVSYGFEWWQALMISMLTLTSAGQLAGISIMINPARYVEMLVSQLTINIRYSFMSVSLSQKVDDGFSGIKRWLLGFFMTDEIFAVSSAQNVVSARFFAGLSVAPYIGWTLGTLFGSLLGNVLPDLVMNSLCIAIYGMFVAIVAPESKKSLKMLSVVAIAVAVSCLLYYLPLFDFISSGVSVSISAVVAAIFGALLFPIKEGDDE